MIISLSGPDTFRSRQKLHQLEAKFRAEIDAGGFQSVRLDGLTATAEELERDLLSMPLFVAKRMVVIESLLARKETTVTQHVAKLLERIPANTIAIFWEGDATKKSRSTKKTTTKTSKATKTSEDLATKLEACRDYAQVFKLLEPAEVVAWIQDTCRDYKAVIKPDAVNALAYIVGTDLWRAHSELTKLIAHAGERAITATDIDQLIPKRLETDVFKLTEALSRHDKRQALELLDQQLRAGGEPLQIFGAIVWQLRILIQIKDWLTRHGRQASAADCAQALGCHPFVAKKALGVMDYYRSEDLRRMYAAALTTETNIKSSQADPTTLLDLFVATL